MKNIPFFTTEFGVAGLVLKEIPYRGEAYITIRDTCDPEKLLEECRDFCRAVGAEKIYATGHPYLEKFPLYTAVWQMCISRNSMGDTDASLFPVTEQTLEQWRNLYNSRMADVANASYMTQADAQVMLSAADGFFIHKGGVLLGIGKGSGEKIDAVVSAVPGAGRDLVRALNHALSGEKIYLQVASANTRAIVLYERIGFIKTAETSRWYFVSDVM